MRSAPCAAWWRRSLAVSPNALPQPGKSHRKVLARWVSRWRFSCPSVGKALEHPSPRCGQGSQPGGTTSIELFDLRSFVSAGGSARRFTSGLGDPGAGERRRAEGVPAGPG